MRGKIKESRLAYKSEWLEVYEDLLSIDDAQPDKRGEKNNHCHYKNTSNVKLFNKTTCFSKEVLTEKKACRGNIDCQCLVDVLFISCIVSYKYCFNSCSSSDGSIPV